MKNKLKRAGRWIAGEASMIWMWIKNLCFVYLTTKSQVRTFTGYGHYWFAKVYADRRTKMSAINKFGGGKRHFVLPTGDYSLTVMNRLELRYFQRKGVIKSSVNLVKILENAYYISK